LKDYTANAPFEERFALGNCLKAHLVGRSSKPVGLVLQP